MKTKKKKKSTGPGEASPGSHLPFNALLPFVFFSLCDTAIVVPSYTVYYPVPVRIRVGVGGDRARQPR